MASPLLSYANRADMPPPTTFASLLPTSFEITVMISGTLIEGAGGGMVA